MSLSLMPHQQAEFEFMKDTPRALLLSETGTGKTPPLLAYAAWALSRGETVLWLTQAGLMAQLQQEAARWLPADCPRPVQASKAKQSDRFVVASHEWAGKNVTKIPFGWLLIVDEADAAGAGGKKEDSTTFLALKESRRRSTRSVFATATPVATLHGLDLHALLDAAGCHGLWSKDRFRDYIAYDEVPTGYGRSTMVPGRLLATGLSHVKNILAESAVATRTEDLGQRLPRIDREDVSVDLSSRSLSEYHAIRVDSSGLTRHQQSLKATKDLGLFSRTTADIVEREMDAGVNHMLVFAEHHNMIGEIVRALTARGISSSTIIGKVSAKERAKIVEEHRNAPSGVLVGSQAIEVGLNLQHCPLLISVMPSWSFQREAQREGRIRRTGSSFDVVRHIRIGPKVDLERHRARRVQDKENLHHEVMRAVPRPPGFSPGLPTGLVG